MTGVAQATVQFVPTPAQLAAARQYAPPLVVTGQADKRGAKLRYINRRAVEYTAHAGLQLEDVYPGATRALRLLAPPPESPEVHSFARETGVPVGDLYPLKVSFGGEDGPRRWRWGWAFVGALVGAALVGPVGAAAIGVAGGLIGGAR